MSIRTVMAPMFLLVALFAHGADAKTFKDVSYGSDRAERMDVYSPDDARNAPVIFMVHGGGWRRGDKTMPGVMKNKVDRWQPRGFIVISANYQMLPEADPLQQADGLSRAIAYAQAHAGEWGGDPAKFILMGHSAGAHLMSLLNAAPERAFKAGAKPWLGTVSLDSAGFDIVKIMEARHPRLYDIAFGENKQLWNDASPIYVTTREAKPLLAACSSKRPDRPCDQAAAYQKKATSLGTRVELLPQPLSHGQMNMQVGLDGDYTKAIEKFMASLDRR